MTKAKETLNKYNELRSKRREKLQELFDEKQQKRNEIKKTFSANPEEMKRKIKESETTLKEQWRINNKASTEEYNNIYNENERNKAVFQQILKESKKLNPEVDEKELWTLIMGEVEEDTYDEKNNANSLDTNLLIKYGDSIVKTIDELISENNGFAKYVDVNDKGRDKYKFMINEYLRSYNLWLNLDKLYFEERTKREQNQGESKIKSDIKIVKLLKDSFDQFGFATIPYHDYSHNSNQVITENKINNNRLTRYGNLTVKNIDKLLENEELLKYFNRKIKDNDKYEFMIKACQYSYRSLLQIYNRYIHRKESGISDTQIAIETMQIVENIFDAVYLFSIDHWNYRILKGEKYSELKESALNASRMNAITCPSTYYNYILYCQKNNIELEVFMRENIILPIWITGLDNQ